MNRNSGHTGLQGGNQATKVPSSIAEPAVVLDDDLTRMSWHLPQPGRSYYASIASAAAAATSTTLQSGYGIMPPLEHQQPRRVSDDASSTRGAPVHAAPSTAFSHPKMASLVVAKQQHHLMQFAAAQQHQQQQSPPPSRRMPPNRGLSAASSRYPSFYGSIASSEDADDSVYEGETTSYGTGVPMYHSTSGPHQQRHYPQPRILPYNDSSAGHQRPSYPPSVVRDHARTSPAPPLGPRRNSSRALNYTDLQRVVSAPRVAPPAQIVVTPQYNRPLIPVMPGLSLPLRGSDETWQAFLTDHVVQTECPACNTFLFVHEASSHVLCSNCRLISPTNGSNHGGQQPTPSLGLGLTVECAMEEMNSRASI